LKIPARFGLASMFKEIGILRNMEKLRERLI